MTKKKDDGSKASNQTQSSHVQSSHARSSHGKARHEDSSSAAPAATELTLAPDADVAFLGGPTSDGKGVAILRANRGRLEAGEVRPLEPGKPIVGEVVSLKPRKAFPFVYDVQTHLKTTPESSAEPAEQHRRAAGERSTSGRSGPPQVASDAYRENWEAIYRPDKKQKLLN